MKLSPAREEFRVLAASGANLIPVAFEMREDLLTPIGAYLRLAGDGPGFLLESAEGGEKVGRYSFIGVVDDHEILRFTGTDPLAEIKARFGSLRVAPSTGLPRFLGGAVGYIGYDCIRYFEPTLGTAIAGQRIAADLELPEAAFMVCRRIVVFDHLRRRMILVANARLDRPDDADAAYESAGMEIASMLDRLARRADSAEHFRPVPVEAAEARGDVLAGVESNFTKSGFEAAVRRAREYIAAGDVFQTVLSQRFTRPLRAKPFEVYRALRALNPSPYMFYFQFGDFALAGSSPEIMVRLEGGEITLRPIAGTRRRGTDDQEDDLLRSELLADAKERAEHLMLVDLGRNDVGRVAVPGSVAVTEFMTVERYSHVMHIVSNVTGKLAPGRDAYDLIGSTFPAGTVSGAPKIRAMEIIAELEPERRGIYAGAAGYIGFDGNSDTAIVLRTVLMRDGRAYVQAGAGVVHDSVPESEFAETVNKAAGMLRALDWTESRGAEELR